MAVFPSSDISVFNLKKKKKHFFFVKVIFLCVQSNVQEPFQFPFTDQFDIRIAYYYLTDHVYNIRQFQIYQLEISIRQPTTDLFPKYHGLIIHLAEQRTGIGKVMGSSPVVTLKFFQATKSNFMMACILRGSFHSLNDPN